MVRLLRLLGMAVVLAGLAGSGKALAGAGDLQNNGGAIVQTTSTGAEEQQWKIEVP